MKKFEEMDKNESQTEKSERIVEIHQRLDADIRFLGNWQESGGFVVRSLVKNDLDFLHFYAFEEMIEKGEDGKEVIRVTTDDIKRIAREIPELIDELDSLVHGKSE